MNSLDSKTKEELIKERNDFEAENIALKAQVNELRKHLTPESQGGVIENMRDMSGRIEWYNKVKHALDKTPEQCLNSIKADAITIAANHAYAAGYKRPIEFLHDYANKLKPNNE